MKGFLTSVFYFSFFLLLSVSLFFSCTKKRKKNQFDLKETLRIRLPAEPPTLDWAKMHDTASALVADSLTEGLLIYDSSTREARVKPALATSWTSSGKGKFWTFNLRKGVLWSDGVEFRAKHVIDAWERLLNPKTGSVYAYFLFNIKNARSYYERKIKDFSKVGVKSEGPYKLKVQLESPRVFFPSKLAHHSTWPIRKDVIEKYSSHWTKPQNIVTLGPFILKTWEHNRRIILERNENFYGKKASIKNIVFYIIEDNSSAVNVFDRGQIDMILKGLPSKEISLLKERKEFVQISSAALEYIGFNTLKSPTNNLKLRKAIAHAISREEIIKVLNKGHTPLGGFIPLGTLGYDPSLGIQFDVKKAKKILSESGYKKTEKIKLMFNAEEDVKRIAENIQSQLKKNLGLEIEVRSEEWKVYLNSIRSSKSTENLYRLGWIADFSDPDDFAKLFASYSKNNHTGWKSKRYDELVEKASYETNPLLRKKLYSKIQKILTEDEVAIFPIYSKITSGLVSKRVKNFYMSPMDRFRFNEVYLEDESKK